jgi:hypothetical protein
VDDVGRFLGGGQRSPLELGEAGLHRRISLTIWRALAEPRFARLLLADPASAIGDIRCTPQQWLQVANIQAQTVEDFARQAEALFWPSRRTTSPAQSRLPPAASQ